MSFFTTERIEHNNATMCPACQLDTHVHYMVNAKGLLFGKLSISLCSYCMRALRDAISRELR